MIKCVSNRSPTYLHAQNQNPKLKTKSYTQKSRQTHTDRHTDKRTEKVNTENHFRLFLPVFVFLLTERTESYIKYQENPSNSFKELDVLILAFGHQPAINRFEMID